MIKVLFFAQLREQLSCHEKNISCDEVRTVLDVRDALVKEFPLWEPFLSHENILAAVNHTLVKLLHPVNDGDEVAFFPPVTGG